MSGPSAGRVTRTDPVSILSVVELSVRHLLALDHLSCISDLSGPSQLRRFRILCDLGPLQAENSQLLQTYNTGVWVDQLRAKSDDHSIA